MKIKFFDLTKFHIKSSFYQKGDIAAMKKLMFKDKDYGHLE